MNHLRSRFCQTRVLVAGDLMLDEYLLGVVNRISPEAPVPVVDVRDRRYVPGGAANVALNVCSLGAQVHIVGVCGNDGAADRLRSLLSHGGIDVRSIVMAEGRVTTSKTRVVAGQQQIVRFDHEDRSVLPAEVERSVQREFDEALDQCQVCLLSDYGKGVLTPAMCRHVIAAAQRRGCQVIVDPKGMDYSKYRGCTLITPNAKEAAQAAALNIENEEDLFAAGERLLQTLPGSSVLVTRGAEGMTLFRSGAAPLTIPTVAQEVFDVVGAGDTAVAALGVALAASLPVEVATRIANIAAGIAVGKLGTVAVHLDELLAHPELAKIGDLN